MKMTRIAASLLLACAATAQAQSSVTIFGITDAGVARTSKVAGNGPLYTLESGLLQSSRLGFRGAEDLGNGVSATFTLEQGVGVDVGSGGTASRLWSRKSTVGLSGKTFGVLDAGWRKDYLDEIGNNYGSVTPFGTFIFSASGNNLNRAGGGSRATNMLYYRTGTFSGFQANVAMGLGETAGSFKAGNSYGGGANYDNGTFGVGFGYWRSLRGTGAAATSSDANAGNSVGCNGTAGGTAGDVCLTTWTVGAKVNAGPLLVRGMYSQVKHPLVTAAGPSAPAFATALNSALGSGLFVAGGRNNTKGEVFDVGADYKLGAATVLKASYIESRYDFLGAATEGKVRQLTVGGEYYLSKRTTVYATAAAQSADAMYTPGILGTVGPGRDDKVTAFGAGLRHTF